MNLQSDGDVSTCDATDILTDSPGVSVNLSVVKRTIRYSVAGCGSSGVGERGTRSGSARRRLTVSRSCELAVSCQHFDGAGLGGVVPQGDRGELGGADVGEPA